MLHLSVCVGPPEKIQPPPSEVFWSDEETPLRPFKNSQSAGGETASAFGGLLPDGRLTTPWEGGSPTPWAWHPEHSDRAAAAATTQQTADGSGQRQAAMFIFSYRASYKRWMTIPPRLHLWQKSNSDNADSQTMPKNCPQS